MRSEESRLAEFISASADFFRTVGGRASRAAHGRRKNIEIIDASRHAEVDVCCVEVEFNARNKFGDGGYAEAYGRYRRMRSDWWAYLEARGFKQWDASTSMISHFVPYPDGGSVASGQPYEREAIHNFAQRLIPYDSIAGLNPYYDQAHEEYGVNWLLQDGSGVTVGPDMGLTLALEAALKVDPRVETFIDLGAGTGELSAFISRNSPVSHILVNEYSSYLREHLRTYLGGLLGGSGVEVEFQFTDASEVMLPARAEVASMGIYYGAQPVFLETRGEELSRVLGEKGVLIVQSGMLENKFNICSLTGEDERLFEWGWYDERCCLKTYFSEVGSVFLADEVMTIASNSKDKVSRIKRELYEKGRAADVPRLTEVKL